LMVKPGSDQGSGKSKITNEGPKAASCQR
jgi:hypothetical protein